MTAVRVRPAPTDRRSVYVYGLAPAAVTLPERLVGVGGRPVSAVPLDGFTAVVSEDVDEREFGVADDVLAHTRVLDRVAETATVLPLAFGSFVRSAAELDDALRPAWEESRSALAGVDGAVQFTLTVRYEEQAALAELVATDKRVARLSKATAGTPEDVRRAEKLELGRLVVAGLERKAVEDAQRILAAVRPLTRAVVERERREPDEVIELAALVDRDATDSFESECERLAQAFAERARFRLLGPQAPYDFVPGGS
jgi:hypothetical protein